MSDSIHSSKFENFLFSFTAFRFIGCCHNCSIFTIGLVCITSVLEEEKSCKLYSVSNYEVVPCYLLFLSASN